MLNVRWQRGQCRGASVGLHRIRHLNRGTDLTAGSSRYKIQPQELQDTNTFIRFCGTYLLTLKGVDAHIGQASPKTGAVGIKSKLGCFVPSDMLMAS